MKIERKDKELYRRVDEVIHYLWDPIGVAGEPYARNEYESYVPKIFGMIKADKESETISKYLHDIINDKMGLTANIKMCDKVVVILKTYKKIIDERS
ncbi:MAG: hypothetical protein LLF92_05795 [Planctomycetaceae bacterium]|nr:hypothetical protein [Planctomycetaceae bacterium]